MRLKPHKKDTVLFYTANIHFYLSLPLPACISASSGTITFFLSENPISVPFSAGVPAMNSLSFVYLEYLYFPSLLKSVLL